MKIIVMDSGLGGKDFINKLKKVIKIKYEFVKLFNGMVSSYNKHHVREQLLNLLTDYSSKNIKSIEHYINLILNCKVILVLSDWKSYNFIIEKLGYIEFLTGIGK